MTNGLNLEQLLGLLSVLTSSRPIGWVIIVLILAFFIRTLQLNWQVQKRLREEQQAVQTCASYLNHIDNPIMTTERYDELDEMLPKHSLTRKTLHWIWKVRRLPNPDLNAILNAVGRDIDPRMNTLRAAPNILLLLGLLGTVFGLGSSVASLVPQIQQALFATNPQALTGNLANTLQEMQTAFATTLWGILTALLSGVTLRRLQQKSEGIYSLIHAVVLELAAPKLLPPSTAAQLEDIQVILNESRDYINSVTTIMDQATTQFKGVLEHTGQSMMNNIKELASVSNALQTSLVTLSNQVQESVGSLNKGANEMRESTQELQRYHHDMRNAYVSLGNLFQEAREHTENQTRAQLNKVEEVQEQFTGATLRIVERVDTVAERLQETNTSFENAGSQYLKATNDSYLKIESGFQALTEQFSQVLSHHQQEVKDVSQALETYGNHFKNLVERLDPSLFPREEWEDIHANIGKLLVITQEMSSSSNKTLKYWSNHSVLLKRILEQIDSMTQKQLAEQVTESVKLLSNIDAHLSKSAPALDANREPAKS